MRQRYIDRVLATLYVPFERLASMRFAREETRRKCEEVARLSQELKTLGQSREDRKRELEIKLRLKDLAEGRVA